jgi:hypothetical protein
MSVARAYNRYLYETTGVNPEAVAVSVATLDELVKHDGAALELEGVDPTAGVVELRLVLDGVECIECVMPRDFLETLSLDVLRRALPDVRIVRIHDPREEVPNV